MSSWELPDNTRRVVRAAAPIVRERQARSASRWLGFTLVSVLILCGAAYGSFRIYLSRLDSRFEKHCKALREARQWRDLNQVSRKWIDANPWNLKAAIFAAKSSEKLGNYEEAVELLLAAPRNQPLSATALAEAAEMQFRMLNQPVAAVKNFEEVLRSDPKEAQSRQRLIFFYAMTMQRQKMVDHIREAIRLSLETREDYVYLVGQDWLIFSNGPQWNHLWRKSDIENEHFNVARALGVVANGYVTPENEARMQGSDGPLLRLNESPIEPDAPEDRRGREAHYDGILRAYLKKYPRNLELLSYFLSRATSAGDIKETATLLGQAPPEAENDGRFWRYKASWQLMKTRRTKDQATRLTENQEAEKLLLRAIELNPFDSSSRHMLATVLREMGETERVDRLEEIYTEGAEIRRLVLQAPSAHIDPELFKRIKDYVAICGESATADAMAKRLEIAPVDDFFQSQILGQ